MDSRIVLLQHTVDKVKKEAHSETARRVEVEGELRAPSSLVMRTWLAGMGLGEAGAGAIDAHKSSHCTVVLRTCGV